MLYEVKSGGLSFAADTFGAELHSLKLDGTEYIWQCGEAWQRYAPILFPFICSPDNREYKAGGKSYKMKANHGFARDMEFSLTAQSGSSLEFSLSSDETTLSQYPYEFEFFVRYTLIDGGVRVENIVRNTGDGDMYFYIGGHPAFNCPLEAGESFTDYYVEYEKNEHITRNIDGTETVLVESGNTLDVTRELFDYDAIILPEPASSSISLKSHKSSHGVTVEFPESRCIAVWSPTGDDRAKFVCLEPWTSVPTNYDEPEKNIEKKAHAIPLKSGGEFTYSYSIIVY